LKTFVKECRWGKFLLLQGDMISYYTDLYGEWSDIEVRLFKRLLTPGSNIVEVGANLGLHTVPLATIAKQGKVVCFEPQRIIFQILCANVAFNNLINVSAHQTAVSDADGSIIIDSSDYEQPWNYGSFSLAEGLSAEGEFPGVVLRESVQTITLDTFPPVRDLASLDLLKIDAEGHETAVLRGAAKVIAARQPIIFVENNNPRHGDELIADIEKLGYAPYWFCSARYQPDNFNRVSTVVPGYDINMVCFPAQRAPIDGLRRALRFAEITDGIPMVRIP